jgi:hypothetical protein
MDYGAKNVIASLLYDDRVPVFSGSQDAPRVALPGLPARLPFVPQRLDSTFQSPGCRLALSAVARAANHPIPMIKESKS